MTDLSQSNEKCVQPPPSEPDSPGTNQKETSSMFTKRNSISNYMPFTFSLLSGKSSPDSNDNAKPSSPNPERSPTVKQLPSIPQLLNATSSEILSDPSYAKFVVPKVILPLSFAWSSPVPKQN